ncbi:MAG: DUF2282 domain-containing protein [Rickettsiales bacterium]|nr:DUF2282 domain-containing protein [Rickettsiales bacterium]
MTKTKLIIPAVALAAVVGAVTLGANDVQAAKPGMEKCYGAVKAGKNDCGNVSGTHGCAGQAAADGAWDEWVYLPEGSCDKLAGATTEPKKG